MQAKSKFSFWRIVLPVTAISGLCAMAAVRPDIQRSVQGSKHAEEQGVPVVSPFADDEARDAKVALFTLLPTGFEPKQLELSQGRYLLVVRNRSGLDEFALRLEREQGERLHESRGRRLTRDTKQFLQLTPGVYVLRELNHPDWTCRLTVSAQ